MIYTFYSYKGGVGRSMALANVAELFYEAGLKVLMVDWDLEAPGLERFFFPEKEIERILDGPGVVDMLLGYKKQMAQELPISESEEEFLPFENPDQFIIDLYPNVSNKGRLWLLPPGRRSAEHFFKYANSVLTFDWQDFYQNWEGARYFEWLRRQFERIADVVLLDSRTGVTEMGGVCTYQFADVVVMFCSANRQSLEGTYRMLLDFNDPQVQEVRGRPLDIVVVPARIENAESNFLNEFQQEFLARFARYTPQALGEGSDQFWRLAIPYIPRYAYRESIAVREKNKASAKEMVEAVGLLAFAISRLAPQDSPIRLALPELRMKFGDKTVVGSRIGDGIVITGEGSRVNIIHQYPDVAPHIPMQRLPRATHFTGREKELNQLLSDLQPGRVVTLCGPGGVGKTALAAEAIWALTLGDAPPEHFPDGIIFHSFYNQPNAALALEAIARAYGEEPQPVPAVAAKRALAGRRALLVLDGAENTDNLEAVLAVASDCGVLITTRRHSDAPAGWQDLHPLPNPQAVKLLQAWGGARAADENIARSICEMVGGLPLAVRLAGRYLAQREEDAANYLAWLEETPLAALDHGERQIDSISILLERSLARVTQAACTSLGIIGRLALAPFSREVMAAALETSLPQTGRVLGELVDYGLLLREETRYQVSHALVHTYARLRMALPADVSTRLAAYYDAFAREQRELGPAGYAVLDAERPHLIAVLTQCIDQECWQEAESLVWAIDDYLDLQGYWTERVTAIQAGLIAARAINHRGNESAFLTNLGLVYHDLGEVERALEYYQQALAIAREIGDRRGEGADLGNLGNAYRDLGQVERALEYYQRALAIAREIGDRRSEGSWLGNLGNAYHDLGQVERAIEYYEQGLAIAREIGDRRGEGSWLGNLGNAYRDLGQVERALEYYQQALTIAREIGDRRGEGSWLGNLGNAYHDLGQVERAIEYYEQGLAIAREIGDRRSEGNWLSKLANIHCDLGRMEQAIGYRKQASTIAREVGTQHYDGTELDVDIQIDDTTRQVTLKGRLIKLTPQEYQALVHLCMHAGQLVTKDQLVNELWPEARGEVGNAAIDAAIYRLRRKLGDDARQPRYLERVMGKGFILRRATFVKDRS
jgi:tetratricopeptide (TPR) repeat protein